MVDTQSFGDRIRDWDDMVEDAVDQDDARKPFDAGVMLAVAELFDAEESGNPERVKTAMAGLRESVEAVLV